MSEKKLGKRPECLVILPTYNEADNISEVVNGILAQKFFDVLIVDDNSPDGTGRIADSLAKASRKVSVIHRQGKQGLGTAYIAGFRIALRKNYDFAFQMDSDLSHSPKYLPLLLKKAMEGNDIVLGSRYVKGGSVNWPFSRKLISKGANFLARTVLGIRVSDVTSGFRCFDSRVLRELDFSRIKSSGYSFLEEILYLAFKKGFKISEVPIHFTDRKLGSSKLGKKEMLLFFATILRLRLSG